MFARLSTAFALVCLTTAALADPAAWRNEWPRTDFTKTTITDWSEIISGGPPKDGIPAIDRPVMRPAAQETRLAGREPVMVLDSATPARAYPIRYLMWHEIVNDTVGGVPVSVTFCPLCNTAMVFDRRVGGQVLAFGVSGKLRHSDMIMFDRQTESWWQQALGQGIAGQMSGRQLVQLPATLESWAQFLARHPDGLVMDQPDMPRAYGMNPYVGYDSSRRPFLYSGESPPHGISPLARVLRVGNRAWPLERLRAAGTLEEAGLVIRWEEGQASALDSRALDKGSEVGTLRVTDSRGRAVVHDMPFAFAFHAFHPEGEWMLAR